MNEEIKLRKKLRKMRLIAMSLLVFMVIVFIVFRRLEDRGLVYSSIAAFAEASMIGALADWFAVVALFRYPLGLKIIPHTAIIANNKSRIAKALANFVVSNFFTPGVIRAKLDKVSVSNMLTGYIASHKETIARSIAKKLPALMNNLFEDTRLENYIKDKIHSGVLELKLYPLLGKALNPAVKAGYHKPIVKGLLSAIHEYIGGNKEKTLEVLGGISKTLTMPIIGDIVYKKVLEFLERQMDEIDTNEEAEINRLLLETFPKLIEDMQRSEEIVQKGEALKLQVLDSEIYQDVLKRISSLATGFKNSVAQNEDEVADRICGILDYLTGSMADNAALREKIDDAIIESAQNIVSLYGSKVGSLIYDTMESWETKDLVDRLELYVGADLQYIRINGTVIGGLAGLAIHLLTRVF